MEFGLIGPELPLELTMEIGHAGAHVESFYDLDSACSHNPILSYREVRDMLIVVVERGTHSRFLNDISFAFVTRHTSFSSLFFLLIYITMQSILLADMLFMETSYIKSSPG
jgi:hypothetical protein